MDLEKLFGQFVQAGVYLRGWSPKTPIIYRRALASFQMAAGEERDSLTKTQLEAWIVWMRQRGLSPAGCNIYIRAMNSFGSWLEKEGHITERVEPETRRPREFWQAEIQTSNELSTYRLLSLWPNLQGHNQSSRRSASCRSYPERMVEVARAS